MNTSIKIAEIDTRIMRLAVLAAKRIAKQKHWDTAEVSPELISELVKYIDTLEQGLRDIKSGKDNPCYIVDQLLGN